MTERDLGAKLVTAVSTCNLPKITLMVGNSYGAGNYGMCGRAYDPTFLFTFINSKISVMGGEQAANVLATVRRQNMEKKGIQWSKEDEEKFKKPILDKYEYESSAYYSTSKLWDDGIIRYGDTRKVIGLRYILLEECYWK